MTTSRRHLASGAPVRTHAARARPLGLAIGTAMVVALTAGWSVASFNGANLVRAAAERAKSLDELLQQRSPGTRTNAELVKTKHKKIVVHERAMPKGRAPFQIIRFEPPKTLIEIVAPPPQERLVSLEAIPIPPVPIPAIAPSAVTTNLPSLIVPPLVPTETPSQPPVLLPPSAAPEPATWLTMLIGFALIGCQVRGRCPAQVPVREV